MTVVCQVSLAINFICFTAFLGYLVHSRMESLQSRRGLG
jgi:hypothetical protein